MTPKHPRKNLTALLLSAAVLIHSGSYAQSDEPYQLQDISLEDLLNITVSSASGIEETLRDARPPWLSLPQPI